MKVADTGYRATDMIKRKVKGGGLEITETTIRNQAKILKDLGGKKKLQEYIDILTIYKQDFAGYDKIFKQLRNEIISNW